VEPPSIARVEWELSAVEQGQAKRAEEGSKLWSRQDDAERARLLDGARDLRALDAQARQGTLDVDSAQLADLHRRWAEAWDRRYARDTGVLSNRFRDLHTELQSAERDLQEHRARAGGLQPGPESGRELMRDLDSRGSLYPGDEDPQPRRHLDSAREELERVRPSVVAGDDADELDRLAEYEWWIGDFERRLGYENLMSIANLDAETPGRSRGQRPVDVLPLPGSGGSAPTLGIPAYVTAPPRLLDTLDPYGGQSGAVAKPIPSSQRTPAQEVLTTERSPLQQAALDGLRNTAITGTSLGLLTTLLYQLGYLAVGGVMYLPGSRPPWAPATPTQG